MLSILVFSKHKTAYEMRISDWSSDVCSSDLDPHTAEVGPARVEIVKPYEEIRLWADPASCELGMDLTFRARTKPYGLRRGTMRAGHEIVWDQSHLFQRSEEQTSELQSLMRISYAVFRLKTKNTKHLL